MINIKNLDPNVKKSYKNVFIYYIWYVATNSAKPLCFIINKINWYIEENNGNKYLTLFPTDESKEVLKKNEELWNKIKDLIKSITDSSLISELNKEPNNLDNYDEKHMKIKFN